MLYIKGGSLKACLCPHGSEAISCTYMQQSNDKISQVADDLAAMFVKDYKCSLQEARDFFYNNIIKNRNVSSLIETVASEKQLLKNATFKNFVKQHKKELYYRLRQYKGDSESRQELLETLRSAEADPSESSRVSLLGDLAKFHVSSQERFVENNLLYDQLASVMDNVHSVVDAGCGVQPLFFPHDRFSRVEKYLALDKDKESVGLMNAFKNTFSAQYDWLFPRVWNISEGWSTVCVEQSVKTFDLALLFKLVPVVKRTSPALLQQLADVPAETIIISGVKESMVKKHDIERKERKAIDSFIKDTGRNKTEEFELGNEFFIILR